MVNNPKYHLAPFWSRALQILSSNWILPVSALFLFTVIRIVGFEGLYGQDSFEYARYTEALTHFYLTGEGPGDYVWPLLYPIVGSLLNLVLPIDWSLQLVSLCSFIGILMLLRAILRTENQDSPIWKIHLFLLVSTLLSPYFLRTSMLCMSDMLTAFFILGAFYQVWKYGRYSKAQSIVLFFSLGAAAIMTRYAAAVLILPLGIWLLRLFWLKKVLPLKPIVLGVFMAVAITLPHWLLRSSNSTDFLQHAWLNSWSLAHLFSGTFHTPDGVATNLVPNIMYMFSPMGHAGYLVLGIPLILSAFLFKNFEAFKSKLLWIILPYLIFLGGIPFQNQRFFTIVFPLVVLWFFPLSKTLWAKPKLVMLGIVGIAVIQSGLFSYSFKRFYKRVLLEREVAAALVQLPAEKTIYTVDMDVSFGYYQVPQKVENIYFEEYTNFQKGALVLVQPEILETQWKLSNPGKNWEQLKKKDLQLKQRFRKGWELYVIK